MNNDTNWTGRAPRTLNDAFGPYQDTPIAEPETMMDIVLSTAKGLIIIAWVLVMIGCVMWFIAIEQQAQADERPAHYPTQGKGKK
jgi:hypothetical protein